jgi:acyl carrier protein
MRGSEEVKNWMNMFRWIVKLIRDEYGIDEAKLTRTANIEQDLSMSAEQVEQLLDYVQEAFGVKFPPGTLDELVKLEELCLLASWLAGFYKRPEFLGGGYADSAMAINPKAAAA